MVLLQQSMEMNYSECIDSPLGWLTILADEKGIRELSFRKTRSTVGNQHTQTCARQLNEYFEGRRKNFDLPLIFKGTKFQVKVWEGLRKIAYAEKKTYQDLARAIKHPKAYRAVGNAAGKNPLPILVPCHRLVASNGGLGGFSSGLPKKRRLLALEKQT